MLLNLKFKKGKPIEYIRSLDCKPCLKTLVVLFSASSSNRHELVSQLFVNEHDDVIMKSGGFDVSFRVSFSVDGVN